MACAVRKAGKHVLLENLAAINEEDARLILKTQKETGMIMTVEDIRRHNSIIQNFILLGQSGLLGKLRHVVVINCTQDEALFFDHWFCKEEMSGGILIEHWVHFFDIVTALSGPKYSEVFGASTGRNGLQRDHITAWYCTMKD